MTVPPFLASLIRTVVPFLVGLLVSLLARLGLGDLVDVAGLTELLTLVVGALYYAAVRWLEQNNPAWGWLIGYATAPTYPTLDEARAGLTPVPASEVVAQLPPDPAFRSDPAGGPYSVPVPVAGPASLIPTGTPVVVVPDTLAT